MLENQKTDTEDCERFKQALEAKYAGIAEVETAGCPNFRNILAAISENLEFVYIFGETFACK